MPEKIWNEDIPIDLIKFCSLVSIKLISIFENHVVYSVVINNQLAVTYNLIVMEKENVRLADQIRFIRELKGFSQESVANYLGISQQAYQKMESGRGRINSERLKKIAFFLSVESNELQHINRSELLIGYIHKNLKDSSGNAMKNEIRSIQEDLKHLNAMTQLILSKLELQQ